MPAMPGWFAKLPEMYLLDTFFSNRNGDLAEKYKSILGVVSDNKSSEIDKVGQVIAAVGGLGQTDLEHFQKHWLAMSDGDFRDPAQFFPGVTCRDGYEAEAFANMLNRATEQACRIGLASDPPKPMAWVWQCAPSTDFVGAAVADGPNAIVMSITTPPYSTNTYAGELEDGAPARAFTFQLQFGEVPAQANTRSPELRVDAQAPTSHFNPQQREQLEGTGFFAQPGGGDGGGSDDGGCD